MENNLEVMVDLEKQPRIITVNVKEFNGRQVLSTKLKNGEWANVYFSSRSTNSYGVEGLKGAINKYMSANPAKSYDLTIKNIDRDSFVSVNEDEEKKKRYYNLVIMECAGIAVHKNERNDVKTSDYL